MSGSLSNEQIEHYGSAGWIAPIDVMSAERAAELADALEQAEAAFPDDLHATRRNNAHVAFPFLDSIVHDEVIIDCVRSLVGDDIALSTTVLFVKEPDSSAFVSWHQDATYMGMGPDNFVTAWLALTPSTLESGCVSVLPGTHRKGMINHRDTFGQDNILTRGQEVVDADPTTAVHLELQPGQMSLHHPWLVHGSQPNQSSQRRVGIAMQSYMGADVRPLRGTHYAMHIAGAPVASEFRTLARPAEPCGDAERALRSASEEALAQVLYDGAKVRRAL